MGFRMSVVVATVIGIASLIAVQKASAEGYIVQEGDTLGRIALSLGLNMDQSDLVYQFNADVMDDAARSFGYVDSRQGELLFPGTHLRTDGLPDTTSTADASSDAQPADPAPAPLIEVNEGIPYPWDFVTIVVLGFALIATIVGGVGYMVHLSRSATRSTT